MTELGVLHENRRIPRRFWRKLISLMSIWANYTRCIFHDQHKTLCNLLVFSPDPAVFYVADKEVSHREIYTLCSICCILFRSLSFLFSHECVHVGHMNLISSIFVRFVFNFSKHFTDHMLQMYRLISHHCLCLLPRCAKGADTPRSAYISITILYHIHQ